MRDIERDLRELGDRAREEVRTRSVLTARALRRIKLRRLGTAAAGAITAIALVLGGSYAVANFGEDGTSFAPAGEGTPPGPSLALFYAFFGGDRAAVSMDAETGTACAFVGLLTDNELFTRVEVVETDGEFVLPLDPSPESIFVDQEGSKCVGDLEEDLIRSVTGSPDRYSLLIDGPAGEQVAAMTLASSDELPDNDRCQRSPAFEPTYLPRGWVPEFQPGSAAGAGLEEIVIGHYGTDDEPGSVGKIGSQFLDVIASSSAFELGEGSEIEVLGQPASLIGPNDKGGYGVRFGFRGCTYSLGGNASRRTIVRFAQGLRSSDAP